MRMLVNGFTNVEIADRSLILDRASMWISDIEYREPQDFSALQAR